MNIEFYQELGLNDSMIADECQHQLNLICPACKGNI